MDSSIPSTPKRQLSRSRILPEISISENSNWNTTSNGRIMLSSGNGSDMFSMLPVNNSQEKVGRAYRNSLDSPSATPRQGQLSARNRRSSFEYQIPTPASVKRVESLDNSAGKRKSYDTGTTPPLPDTVARLKTMSSFKDNSIGIGGLNRDRSLRDIDTSGEKGKNSARDEKMARNKSFKNNMFVATSADDDEQDKFDHSGFQDRSIELQLIEDRRKQRRAHPGPFLDAVAKSRAPIKPKINLSLLFSNSIGPTLISDHIVLGGRDEAADKNMMRNLGITHVLNVAQQLPNSHEGSFVYLKLPILDNLDVQLAPFVKQAINFIKHVESIGGRVLVHCVAGVSRSVSMILLHMMTNHRIDLVRSYNHIKRLRPYIKPNDSFKVQLAQYELVELGYSTVAEKTAGPDWDFYGINNIKANLNIKSTPASMRSRVPTRSERFGKGSSSTGGSASSNSNSAANLASDSSGTMLGGDAKCCILS